MTTRRATLGRSGAIAAPVGAPTWQCTTSASLSTSCAAPMAASRCRRIIWPRLVVGLVGTGTHRSRPSGVSVHWGERSSFSATFSRCRIVTSEKNRPTERVDSRTKVPRNTFVSFGYHGVTTSSRSGLLGATSCRLVNLRPVNVDTSHSSSATTGRATAGSLADPHRTPAR